MLSLKAFFELVKINKFFFFCWSKFSSFPSFQTQFFIQCSNELLFTIQVASVLLENGASLENTTKKGFTPLHLAAKYGNIKVAQLLLQKNTSVDAQGKNGVTPLHVASHYDHQNVALLLLDKGASPHATAKNGHTPLHIAARKNQMDIATTLLEYGALPDAESKAGFTPLHLSSQVSFLIWFFRDQFFGISLSGNFFQALRLKQVIFRATLMLL